jgi:hypothetical protein
VQRQLAFDRLAQILHEMEPVADLMHRGGGPTRGLGVPAVAVPTDRVDVGMRHQPLLDGLRGVIIEHVDHGVPFQVHQDGAVGAPFALGPFIHADHLRLHRSRRGPGTRFHPAQQRVIADGQPDACGEPFARSPAKCVADQPRHDIGSAGPASVDRRDPGEAVGKEPDGTHRGEAAPPTDANLQRDDRPDRWQIFQGANIRAMPRR